MRSRENQTPSHERNRSESFQHSALLNEQREFSKAGDREVWSLEDR